MDSRRPQTWILGRGKTLSTTWAEYRAPAKAGKPAVTQWSRVWDGTREGKEDLIDQVEPFLIVARVETNNTGEMVANQLQEGEDFVTEEYTVCKNAWSRLIVILRSSDDSAYCNAQCVEP